MHASAFGFSIKEENFNKFLEMTNEELKDFDFNPCYYVDLEVTMDQLTDTEIFAIGSNADLWGQQLDEPLLAITNITINADTIQFIGSNKNTLKITFPGRKVNMIKFHISEEEKAMLSPENGTMTITAIGKCALNHFNGTVTPQLILEDFEIVRKKKWDF